MTMQLEVGRWYVAKYPRANYAGVKLAYEERRFRVDGATTSPPTLATILADPLIRRLGRRLKAWDFDKGAERTLYEGALAEVREIEAPEEIAGWQVVTGGHVVLPFVPTQARAESCVKIFNSGACGERTADAVPVRLPNLASNLYRKAT